MRISDWSSDVCSSDLLDADHLAVIFDADRHNFRNEIYPAYKAQRPEAPEDLVPQFPLIREATRAFNVPCIEKEGFEADDLIATYARRSEEHTSELQSLMRISYAVFCLKKKKKIQHSHQCHGTNLQSTTTTPNNTR